jgi:uncharacterized membrane protein
MRPPPRTARAGRRRPRRRSPAANPNPWAASRPQPAAPAAASRDDAPGEVADPPEPPKRRPGLEEALTLRWGTWLGAGALLLAGVFLLRTAIEEGWLGPEARCALAAALALALILGAEWLRRRPAPDRPNIPWPDQAPAALAAGGVAILFGAAYATAVMYALVPPLAGFALMAVAALAGLALALVQGPLVAAIGIAGAYLTPALVETGDPSLPGLFAYLLVVTAAALAVVRQVGAAWLGWAATVAAALWVLVGGVIAPSPGDLWAVALFVPAAAALHLALLPGAALDHPIGRRLAWLPFGVLALAGLFTLFVDEANVTATAAAILLLTPVAVWKGLTEPRLDRLPWLAACVGLLLLLAWPIGAWSPADEAVTVEGAVQAILPTGPWAPELLVPFLLARDGPGGAATRWRAPGASGGRPARCAGRRCRPRCRCWSCWSPMPACAASRPTRAGRWPRSPSARRWCWLATLARREGALARSACMRPARLRRCARRGDDPGRPLADARRRAVPAAARLDRGAGRAAGAAPRGGGRGRRGARAAGAELARAGVRARAHAGAERAAPGLWRAGRALRARGLHVPPRGDDLTVAVLEAGAVAFATVLLLLQVRHAVTGGEMAAFGWSFREAALQTLGLAVLATLLRWLNRRLGGRPVLLWGWRLQQAMALAFGLLLLPWNPAFDPDAAVLRTPVLNELLLAYAIPGAARGIAARAPEAARPAELRKVLAAYAFVAAFAWVTLEVRHLFHPEAMALAFADPRGRSSTPTAAPGWPSAGCCSHSASGSASRRCGLRRWR